MGGSSILFTGFAFGIILSVSRSIEEEGKEPVKEETEKNTEIENE
jgi:cell division protein FtsW (lipid II flippase)